MATAQRGRSASGREGAIYGRKSHHNSFPLVAGHRDEWRGLFLGSILKTRMLGAVRQ